MAEESLKDRLARVNERIAAACARAGRNPAGVKLLAVTKVFGPEVICEAYQIGLREFGENYVQEMERKVPAIAGLSGARFHLIGHLQSNKTKKAAEMFASVDTVDSVKLARRLDAEAKPLDVMIEVKLSDEEAKSGAAPGDVSAIVEAIRSSANLRLTGLMTVPPWSGNPGLSRPYFAELQELAARHAIAGLSMGMSNDLEVAVEEGATLVRVGTALFGEAQEAVTVGYHAPAPGSATGVADYAETLLTALQRLGRVEIGWHGEIDLYHLGNNRFHEEIYARALDRPGVIVLHDAVLQHFFLGTRTHQQYIEEWVYNYGEWRRDLGEELWRERGRSGVDPRYFEYPLLRRIVERSRAVIVHNAGAAAMAREHGARRVEVIPHFAVPAALPGAEHDAAATSAFRRHIGIEPRARLFAIFGYLREPKRVMTCLSAFRELHAARPDTALLVAGEPVSGDLARLLDREPPHPAIKRMGHLREQDLMIAAAAVDGCLNLRYPAAGETSGIAVRLMGMGKPVIVSDIAENSAFPETAVLRVRPGVAERAELFDHMVLLAAFPQVARDIGEQARVWIERHHALDTVAQRYWDVLCALA